MKDVLLLKGEEKAKRVDFSKAQQELKAKFSRIDPLTFGHIRYMICYAAANGLVQLFAIDGSNGGNLLPLSQKFDLYLLENRVKFVKCIINILRVFLTISNLLPDHAIPLGKAIDNGRSLVTIFPDHVRKVVKRENLLPSWQQDHKFLPAMYEYARNCHGLVQVHTLPKYSRHGATYTVKLATRGLPLEYNGEEDVKEMTRCVLTGLRHLHAGGYTHRDIRRPNILYVPGYANSKYVLIDFEHAGPPGEPFDENLAEWDADTLEDGRFTEASDLYQFGKLLKGVLEEFGMATDGLELARTLMAKTCSAELALSHGWLKRQP